MKYIMARRQRLAPQVYTTIKDMLKEGKDFNEIFNTLKPTVPGLKRTQIYSQNYEYKKNLAASVQVSLEKTEPIILDSNAKTEPIEEGWMEIPNLPRPNRNEDRPRMGSNDSVQGMTESHPAKEEVPAAVRPSMVRKARQVPATSSAIDSAIMKWELQGFTITTTRGDTINIELSPDSLKDIVNHLLR